MFLGIRRHPWRASIAAAVLFAIALPTYWLVWAWGTRGCVVEHHSHFPNCYNDFEYPGAYEEWKARGGKAPEPPFWPF